MKDKYLKLADERWLGLLFSEERGDEEQSAALSHQFSRPKLSFYFVPQIAMLMDRVNIEKKYINVVNALSYRFQINISTRSYTSFASNHYTRSLADLYSTLGYTHHLHTNVVNALSYKFQN